MKFVIINADDFGLCESINRGIFEALDKKVISSTSVMVYGNAVESIKYQLENSITQNL